MTDMHSSNEGRVDENVEYVLSHARMRPAPESARKEQMYAELRDEWRARKVAAKRKRNFALTGIAATILIAIVLSLQSTNETQLMTSPDAVLVRSAGSSSTINGEPVRAALLANADLRLQRGDVLATGANAAFAVDWQSYGSLRVNSSTTITLLDSERIAVASGQVYYDSQSLFESDVSAIQIETPFGPIRHMGTQFLATVADGGITISVREGQVSLGDADRRFEINAGESAYIDRSLTPVVTPIGPTDDAWVWAAGIAPARDVDGRSTREIIDWVARETGHAVEYLDDRAAIFASQDQLPGIGAVEPLQALTVIPVATELEFDIDSETIRIKLKGR